MSSLCFSTALHVRRMDKKIIIKKKTKTTMKKKKEKKNHTHGKLCTQVVCTQMNTKHKHTLRTLHATSARIC